MATKLYWTEGPWRGKLALSARPRGGDWLEDEIAAWRSEDVNTVLSLLTAQEQRDLDLQDEAKEVKLKGMRFLSLPIPDREVPRAESDVRAAVEKLDADLSSGKNVVIHCRQGIGRTGLVGACLLVGKGMSPGAAIDSLSASRGLPVPETPEQRRWIDQYATNFAGAK
ncbi:MAG TPA: dual specificity protein phosphatase family protein [Terriglobales bacterium]|nr:dual specificity protein phosphatase family protein [Terriglobales bacterium]